MEEILAYRQELLAELEADVTRLAKIAARVSSQDWFHLSGDDQPTPHYILVSLWAEDAHEFTPQVRRILDENMPLLSVFNIDSWMAENYASDEPAGVIIENLASLRTWEVSLLCGLDFTAWSRLSRHPRWGVHTLQWWVEAQRDTSHQYFTRLLASLDM